ncbi:MAG TPA: endonuclease/exonuclease/phosphatase family protein [Streptosporangiaceae bacterium]
MTVRPAVTIVSLNLHSGLSAAGRPFDVADVLTKLDADLIAVQEAWWATDDGADPVAEAAQARGAQLLRAELSTGRSLAELNIAPRSERGTWGIAVLTRLPVLSHEILSLGRPDGELVGRAALICSVTAPGGWPLRLACTHLSPRLNSPAQLLRLTRHLTATAGPTVIAGDLNMPRTATWMAAGYTPVLRGRTFPADRPRVQLDHLLAGPGLTCLSATVLPPVGSDHLPVTGRFAPAVKPRLAVTGGPGGE